MSGGLPAITAQSDVRLTEASVRGASWLLMSTVATSVLQLVSVAVLGRLLPPSDFGVVAAALLLTRVVHYFSQFGLGNAVVQKPTLSDDDIRAAAWLAMAAGSVAMAAAAALAPLLSRLLHQPEAVSVAQVLSLSFLISAVGTTPVALLRRRLRFRVLAVLEVVSYAAGYLVVGVGAVLAGAGLWSLVLASLTQTAVQAVAALLIVRHPMALLPPPGRLAPLARFGGQVSVVGLLEFASLQIDSAGVARGRGAADLGQYTRGTLLTYPIVQAALVVTRVLLSTFARVQETARLQRAYCDALVVVATGSLVAAAVLAGGHDAVVLGLLGVQWTATAGVLPWLAGASALQALSQLPAALCEARGVLRPKIVIQLVVIGVFVAGVVAAGRADAPLWCYAASWLVAEVSRQLLYLLLVVRRLHLRAAALLRDIGEAALPAVATFPAVVLTDNLVRMAGGPAVARLAAILVTGAVVPTAIIAAWPTSRIRGVVRSRALLTSVPAGRAGRRLLTHLFG